MMVYSRWLGNVVVVQYLLLVVAAEARWVIAECFAAEEAAFVARAWRQHNVAPRGKLLQQWVGSPRVMPHDMVATVAKTMRVPYNEAGKGRGWVSNIFSINNIIYIYVFSEDGKRDDAVPCRAGFGAAYPMVIRGK